MKNNNLIDDFSFLEVRTVNCPPVKLDFVDWVNCPICDLEIDVKNKVIDEKSYVFCENCKHKILFKIIKI